MTDEHRTIYRLATDEVEKMDSFRRTKHTAVLVIMFTDLQGSSRRVDMLESAASGVFPELHRKFAEIVERNNGGRFIKDEGDATMSIFSEPSTAVERALEIQQCTFDLNKQRPGEPPILARIGLHLGQVVVKDELATDALGSNVSIAWRVQSLA
ncbi:MAG: adenylate/guanylate cyclase domain-containing protein, partial [Chloroflexi bacterium]|nr:adenylate/guanylate cyclase domain-containing protein [Chloroflexota bacterium]